MRFQVFDAVDDRLFRRWGAGSSAAVSGRSAACVRRWCIRLSAAGIARGSRLLIRALALLGFLYSNSRRFDMQGIPADAQFGVPVFGGNGGMDRRDTCVG